MALHSEPLIPPNDSWNRRKAGDGEDNMAQNHVGDDHARQRLGDLRAKIDKVSLRGPDCGGNIEREDRDKDNDADDAVDVPDVIPARTALVQVVARTLGEE